MNTPALEPLNKQDLHALAERLRLRLLDLYGDRLERLVLFGSYARGDFRAHSDVDFLVVLRQDSVAYGQEVDQISTVSSQLGLDYTVHVSAKPVSASTYHASDRLFYQTVRREGITI